MKNFSDIQNLVREDIKAVDDLLINRLESEVALINQVSSYIINAGGKRIRPLLVILVSKALGYQGINHHVMAAVIELIHTATLIHDDIVDESEVRRGTETPNQVWGNAASVLVGDFIYSRAFEIMVEPNSMEIMKVVSKATNAIAEGEVLQLLNIGNKELKEADYLKVIEKKTACLFQAATQIAAIISDSDSSIQNQMKSFGLHLGNAFQIVDDVLDYQSDEELLGKRIGDDLSEGKMTLPLIHSLSNSSKVTNKKLRDIVSNNNVEEIDTVLEIFQETGSIDYTINRAKEISKKAKQCLVNLNNSAYENALSLLCDISVERIS
ncbi:polyprenyl synthetase family protein [Gammaproteobacteria bacterium]|nr:polyprenyl synthetase family protein [Gammaproteobacteria bacterium]